IGASEPASADHVRVVTSEISRVLSERSEVRSSSVIYGGSAQRGTLTALGGAVDGLFLGRFVHDPREMAAIVEEAAAIS
ncbi:MAG: triose-phosphate isomerase, partial [Leucobacter sp.]